MARDIEVEGRAETAGFRVALTNFEGPFDLLLQLIGAHRLDVTDVALAEVTDEFVAYTRMLSAADALEETTQFLVVAATLLDLKTARLLPRETVADEEDLALLESRDLLFARLLQYKAFKQVAELFSQWQREARRRYPRMTALEERFAHLLPPVVLDVDPAEFAVIAAGVFRQRPDQTVRTDHVHEAAVSVPEQAEQLIERLRHAGIGQWLTFQALTSDCGVSIQTVGRFLALLELYKAQVVDARQDEVLTDLWVSWTGREVDPTVLAAGVWD